jgi:hypothetical protein
VIQFDQDVSASLTATDLTVFDRTQNLPVTGITLAWDAATNTATFTLPSELANGDYRATLTAVDVANAGFTTLDGDQSGAAGGDYKLDFFVLMGDADRDRTVNLNDLIRLANPYGSTSGVSYSDGDFDSDGTVNLNDLIRLANNYGTTLGSPASTDSAMALAPAEGAASGSPAAPTVETSPVVESAPLIETATVTQTATAINTTPSPVPSPATSPAAMAVDGAAFAHPVTKSQAPVVVPAFLFAKPAVQATQRSRAKRPAAPPSQSPNHVTSKISANASLGVVHNVVRKPSATPPIAQLSLTQTPASPPVFAAIEFKPRTTKNGLLFSACRILA